MLGSEVCRDVEVEGSWQVVYETRWFAGGCLELIWEISQGERRERVHERAGNRKRNKNKIQINGRPES